MTRFARAKGSKSSNERAPEDSTPWEVMKEQLLQAKKENEESKKREEAEKQRIENYENFLKEHKSQKRKATWCDFPKAEGKLQVSQQSESPSKKKRKEKQKLHNGTDQAQPVSISPSENTSNDTESKKSKKKKLKKQKTKNISYDNDNNENVETSNKETRNNDVENPSHKDKKFKKKQKKNHPESVSQSYQQNDNGQAQTSKSTKNNKNKKKHLLPENNESSKTDKEVEEIPKNVKSNQNSIKNKKNKNGKKMIDGIPVRRKPIDDHSFQLIINGKEVELVRYDGFPIMKKDAERIDELKKNMINKGIPKSEVNRTLKLERRRAEKALARLKRDVCYNCRKGGHNLSDCPDLKTKIPGVGAPDGLCFKCGSTEHRQFECKVQKDKEFRFATCFICKEPGHIARQCPDNPKGLYPNGGGCKLCGDVTHLRKDCPTTMSTKEETSIKLQTLDSTDNLEGIDQKITTTPKEVTKKTKKIKF